MLPTDNIHLQVFDVVIEFHMNTLNFCTFKGFPGKQKEILKGREGF